MTSLKTKFNKNINLAFFIYKQDVLPWTVTALITYVHTLFVFCECLRSVLTKLLWTEQCFIVLLFCFLVIFSQC